MKWGINLNVQHQVVMFLFENLNWREIGDCSIVNHNINRTKNLFCLLDKVNAMLLDGEITSDSMRFSTGSKNSGDDTINTSTERMVAFFYRSGGNNNPGSLHGISKCNGFANSTTGASDYSHLPR